MGRFFGTTYIEDMWEKKSKDGLERLSGLTGEGQIHTHEYPGGVHLKDEATGRVLMKWDTEYLARQAEKKLEGSQKLREFCNMKLGIHSESKPIFTDVQMENFYRKFPSLRPEDDEPDNAFSLYRSTVPRMERFLNTDVYFDKFGKVIEHHKKSTLPYDQCSEAAITRDNMLPLTSPPPSLGIVDSSGRAPLAPYKLFY